LWADEENYEPRPSRMLKCRIDVFGYAQFVWDKWNSLQVAGWGGSVIREKLKLIKLALKEWHETHIQNMTSRIEALKIRLAALVSKGEVVVLSVEEV
jgi:hypothetical protein